MSWGTLAAIIGILFVVEGVLLLTIKTESWQRLCELLSALSAGQVHTIGAAMCAVGAVFMLISAVAS